MAAVVGAVAVGVEEALLPSSVPHLLPHHCPLQRAPCPCMLWTVCLDCLPSVVCRQG